MIDIGICGVPNPTYTKIEGGTQVSQSAMRVSRITALRQTATFVDQNSARILGIVRLGSGKASLAGFVHWNFSGASDRGRHKGQRCAAGCISVLAYLLYAFRLLASNGQLIAIS